MTRQFHRPARLDPEAAENIEGSQDTAVASELAHLAAQALIGGFATASGEDEGGAPHEELTGPLTREGVVRAVASHGVDDVAELWADSPRPFPAPCGACSWYASGSGAIRRWWSGVMPRRWT